jgi:hypothetical protein
MAFYLSCTAGRQKPGSRKISMALGAANAALMSPFKKLRHEYEELSKDPAWRSGSSEKWDKEFYDALGDAVRVHEATAAEQKKKKAEKRRRAALRSETTRDVADRRMLSSRNRRGEPSSLVPLLETGAADPRNPVVSQPTSRTTEEHVDKGDAGAATCQPDAANESPPPTPAKRRKRLGALVPLTNSQTRLEGFRGEGAMLVQSMAQRFEEYQREEMRLRREELELQKKKQEADMKLQKKKQEEDMEQRKNKQEEEIEQRKEEKRTMAEMMELIKSQQRMMHRMVDLLDSRKS